MAGIKIHELAKEFGMSSKELLEAVQKMGIPAKSHATSLVDAYVGMVRVALAPEIEKRKALIEAQAAKEAAEEKARLAAEELEAKAAEEAHRIAEEEERQRREALRKIRDADVSKDAEKDASAVPVAAEEPAPVVADTATPEVVKPASPTLGLEERIAAEKQRLSEEASEKSRAKARAKAKHTTVVVPADVINESGATALVTPSGPGSMSTPLTREHPVKKKAAKSSQKPSAVVEPTQPPVETPEAASGDDKEYYAEMAKQALQREKVLAEMRADIAAAQKDNDSRSKKKKKKKKGDDIEDTKQETTTPSTDKNETPEDASSVAIPEGSTVSEVAEILEVATNDIIKRLFLLGNPLSLTQTMTNDLIELIAEDLGRTVHITTVAEEMTWTFEDKAEDLQPRSPVVTVMGHVDHGKTSLLDAIRETGVAASEAGGITQHIGASVVQKNGRTITFIDTPGHEAFTAMRARGANITDVVILVVAADDGVMPQTVEAISHAKAAGVPIIVAINKIDKEGANPETVKQMLTEYGVIPEEWGGKNIFVNISAKKRTNIDELLEMILLQADILELKANPSAPGFGTVIESKLDKGRGPVATVLVQRGTLHVGDTLVAGTAFGRIRALIDAKGKHVKTAKPSEPVEILGLGSVPSAGDEFLVFTDERKARALADERSMKQRIREHEATRRHVSLDDLFSQIEAGELQSLNLIVKVDVQGSIEALRDALGKMDQSEVRIDIIHAAVGGITETDVQLATASDAIIIGFNVRPTPGAKVMAAEENVDMRMYRVIYQAIEEINAARVGMLAPDFVEEDTARVEVRDLFRVPKMGLIAGAYVLEGEISRDDKVRVVRDGTVIFEGRVGSLRRFKEDVKSVKHGFECGIGVDGYQDLKEGDIIEGYKINEVKRES